MKAVTTAILVLLVGGLTHPPEPIMVNRLTPILTVDAIEPCLPFWTEVLGFRVTDTVPEGDALGFAILRQGETELMFQTRASVAADVPAVLEELGGGSTMLFLQVDALEPYLEGLEDVQVLVPRRATFYGMDEIFVRSPCGAVVGLAAPLAGAGEG